MTPEYEALARRAVACKNWRRTQGMAGRASPKPGGGCATMPPTITIVDPDGSVGALDDGREVLVPDDGLPDLSHPATLGWLLALVRAAGGDSTLHLQPYSTFDSKAGEQRVWWRLCSVRRFPAPGMPAFDVIVVNPRTYLAGPTEAAALVVALENAP